MTRFEREISGALGAFWKASAEKELQELQTQLADGKITIDENGIARNQIGRIVTSEILEKLSYITDKVDTEATQAASQEETARVLESYRRNKKPATAEEIAQMRAAFGEGTTIVDVITNDKITL